MPAFERNFSALVGPALQQLNRWRSWDDEIIHAVNNHSLPDRGQRMKKRLRRYRVHRIKGGVGEVARVIVDFADEREQLAPGCDYAAILQQFEMLYGRCSAVVPQKEDGSRRDITSLTSKALWVCYPDIIPIYDNYAEQALQVISRLMPLNLREAEAQHSQAAKRYAPFSLTSGFSSTGNSLQ